LDAHMASLLNSVSFWALMAALGAAGIIITVAMIKGMLEARAEEQIQGFQEEVSRG